MNSARRGLAWPGEARQGGARHGSFDRADWQRSVSRNLRVSNLGQARRGRARLGAACHGASWQGEARTITKRKSKMRIQITFAGTTPLIMHSDKLADSANEYTVMIKELTAKKKNKTTADEEQISKLEWMGSSYVDNNNVVIMPCGNLIRCMRDAAAITKNGRDIARAMSPITLHVPLLIADNDGELKERKLDALWGDPKHIDRRMAKVGQSRVKRTRPIFPQWAVTATFELLETVLNYTTVVNICEAAGLTTGLGDARILGFGRFEANVKKLKAA